MTGRELDELLGVARRAVAEAAAVLRTVDPAAIRQVTSKSTPLDLVTEWDPRVETMIREVLEREAPGIPILGEECGMSGTGQATGDRRQATGDWRLGKRWLVDPIDGTVNFSHGIPWFGVTVALEEDGEPVVGVIAAPVFGWETWGRRGGGAWDEQGRRMAVSATSELSRAVLATGFPYDRATTRRNFGAWDRFQVLAGACRRFGAASLDLMMVARGWIDGYWEGGIEPWDLSAGALLIREAGGLVTGLTGERFSSDEGAAVATNGAIHKDVIDQLLAVGAPAELLG